MTHPHVIYQPKSNCVHMCLVVAMVNCVPEIYTNVTILMSKTNLPVLGKGFCVVADLKLIDITVGIYAWFDLLPYFQSSASRPEK